MIFVACPSAAKEMIDYCCRAAGTMVFSFTAAQESHLNSTGMTTFA